MSSLIAVLAVILVSMWPIAQYYRMVEEGNKRAVVAVTAGQFSMLLGGIKKYIRAHTNDLINDIPVGSSTTVSLATLTAEHDLPAGFTTTNPYNQTWVVYATQSASGVLDGRVISYGGQTLSPRDAVAIALKAGAQGGYIPPNDLISGLNSGMAVGGGGTWSQSMAGFPNPGAGHLAGLVASADDVNNNPNYLYRVGVPGHDELNTMDVALNMGGNNINNAATVNAVQGVFANNVTVTSGGCAFNAPGTCLYGDGANTAVRTKGGVYFQHMDGSAADTVADHATVQALLTGTDNGTAVAGAACSPNGAFASSTNGTGAHLECVSGRWKTLGLTTAYQVQTTQFNTNDTGWIQNAYGSVIFVTIMWADTANCNKNGYQLAAYVTNSGTSNLVDVATENNPDFYKSGNVYFFVSPGESWRITGAPWNRCPKQSFRSVVTVLQ